MTTPLSVSMALDALEEQCDTVRKLKAEYDEALAVRDSMIRSARDNRVPERTLVSRCSLSRDSIHRIAHSAPKA